jgi:predicted O-methyltransferase YrrM
VTTADFDPAPWYAGKELSTDWSSAFFATWAELLAPRRDQPLDVLEIGSWEGRSALFFLHFLPQARLTCVDTFAGGAEHVGDSPWVGELPHVEERFRANLAPYAERVRVLKTRSTQALATLADEGARFDLVLVDGSHEAADVRADAEGSWALLRPDGWLVLDDYEWAEYDDPARTPRAGIDAFLAAHEGEYVELERGWQVIVQRRDMA